MVLRTLCGFLDWVATSVVMDSNGLLLQLLCLMLADDYLYLDAAECLLLVTSRKVNRNPYSYEGLLVIPVRVEEEKIPPFVGCYTH